ncbi:MAG: TspO/MBR family protein [Candidatus Gottesmanbacteria bacterium]
MKINYPKLILSIFICLLAGFLGSYFTAPAISTWYVYLQKPFFSPPNWIFAPVWTTLYILMGISAGLVWQKGLDNKKVKLALSIFGVQLVLNILWSFMFFGLQIPFLGLVTIIFLWLAILITIKKFLKINRTAGLLLIPYILWVSFASILNLAIHLLNR